MRCISIGKKRTSSYWRGNLTATTRKLSKLKSREKERTSFFQLAKGEGSFAIGISPIIWQILFFYLPLALLFGSSIIKMSASGKVQGLTLDHFAAIFNFTYFRIIGNSILLSLITTFLCLSIGFPVAYYIATRKGLIKNFLLFLLIIPFWTNFILHIYAWFFVLEKHGVINNLLQNVGLIHQPLHILNSYAAVVMMMVYFYLPFMILPLYSSLERFDPLLLEASYDLGAGRSQTIRRILLPLTMGAIRAGILLVYIPSFGEFVIPELLGGDRVFFVGNLVSLFVMGDKTAPAGIAFTVLSTLVLLSTLVCINTVLQKGAKLLAGVKR